MAEEDSKPVVGPSGASNDLSVEDAVVTQIEFYLSDSNLPFDKFLYGLWADSFVSPNALVLASPAPQEVKQEEEGDKKPNKVGEQEAHHVGWLPLSKLTSFKRMTPHLESPPKGLGSIDKVAQVLQSKSSAVQVKQFSKDDVKEWFIRRTTTISRPEDTLGRSIYAKGFPVPKAEDDSDEAKKKVKQEELELQKRIENWARALDVGAAPRSVRMRREDKPPPADAPQAIPLKNRGPFKGSIFIEYSSKDSVQKFLKLDPKPTFDEKELEIMSKADYVEMKRKIYAPDAKIEPETPKNPYAKRSDNKKHNSKPFNAWAERLIGPDGIPEPIPHGGGGAGGDKKDSRKRKNDNDPEERDVLYDDVRFTARKTGQTIEVVDRETVGQGEGGWATNRVLRFTLVGEGEGGENERFNHVDFKHALEPIAQPGFVNILNARPIASLPSTSAKMDTKADDAPTGPVGPGEDKLTAPPAIGSSTLPKPVKEPLKGQACFKTTVSDEQFEKLKSEIATWKGKKVEWSRAPAEEEREWVLSRAQFHAEQAFNPNRGTRGGRGGGGGGRGGGSGRGRGRGGNRGGGGRGGGGGDRSKRPRTT